MARRARPTVGLFPGLALVLPAVPRERRHTLRGVGPENILAVRWPPCRVAADLHRMDRGHYHRSRPPLLLPVTLRSRTSSRYTPLRPYGEYLLTYVRVEGSESVQAKFKREICAIR